MSADLLEAFGGEGENHTVQPSPLQSKLVNDKSNETQSRDTGLIYSRRFDPQPAPSREKPLWTASEGGNDVLFDAADEELQPVDDDFGDFEDAQQLSDHDRIAEQGRPRPAPPSAVKVGQSDATLIDLLSLEDNTQPRRQTEPVQHGSSGLLATDLWDAQTPLSSSKAAPLPSPPNRDDDWGDFEDVGSLQPEDPITIRQKSGDIFASPQPAKIPQKAPPASDPTFEDDWAAFEDGAAEPVAKPPKPSTIPKQPPQPTEDDDWDAFEDGMPPTATTPTQTPPTETPSAFPPSATRPTNIPPPSTILSLLPSIYSTLTLTTTPSAPALLLHLYQATARVAAARPQRWRRDTLLAQSTRIAPAGAGGKSGMKLSSLNKGEAAREEREASEALAAWNAGVPRWHGVLRESGIKVGGGAGGAKGWRLQLPLGVRSVAAREGGLEAGYVCPVCGMKRSERVVGVDDGVEDVFGEFWVEGWGHRACGEVWYTWKGMLGQR